MSVRNTRFNRLARNYPTDILRDFESDERYVNSERRGWGTEYVDVATRVMTSPSEIISPKMKIPSVPSLRQLDSEYRDSRHRNSRKSHGRGKRCLSIGSTNGHRRVRSSRWIATFGPSRRQSSDQCQGPTLSRRNSSFPLLRERVHGRTGVRAARESPIACQSALFACPIRQTEKRNSYASRS